MPTSDAPPDQPVPGDPFGWVGVVAGLLALALALLPGWVAPLYDPPAKAIHQQAADWLGRLKDQAAEAVGGGDPASPPAQGEAANPWRDPRIALGALLLGFVALGLAAVAFARREGPRVTACALTLGAGAIASEYLLTALVILVFAVTAVALAAVARRG
jgi:hypothetical protein